MAALERSVVSPSRVVHVRADGTRMRPIGGGRISFPFPKRPKSIQFYFILNFTYVSIGFNNMRKVRTFCSIQQYALETTVAHAKSLYRRSTVRVTLRFFFNRLSFLPFFVCQWASKVRSLRLSRMELRYLYIGRYYSPCVVSCWFSNHFSTLPLFLMIRWQVYITDYLHYVPIVRVMWNCVLKDSRETNSINLLIF